MATDKRPIEQQTVLTTIVGGRPPGSGKPLGPIPRGIEVLVKKAAVDPDFKRLLLEKRGEAAREIGLTLDPAESMMLAAAPRAQLEAIVAQTTVAPSLRPAFLGRAAAVMLVALGAGAVGGGAAASYLDQPDEPAVTSTAAPTPVGLAVSKADADAMQARIIREYQSALLEAVTAYRAGGFPVRFALSVDARGAVGSVRHLSAASTGTPTFRAELTRLVRAWQFPDLHSTGAATVIFETAVDAPAPMDTANPAPTPTVPPPAVSEGARPDRPPTAGGARPDVPLKPPTVRMVSLTVLPGVVPAPAPTPTPPPSPSKGMRPDRPQ